MDRAIRSIAWAETPWARRDEARVEPYCSVPELTFSTAGCAAAASAGGSTCSCGEDPGRVGSSAANAASAAAAGPGAATSIASVIEAGACSGAPLGATGSAEDSATNTPSTAKVGSSP
jgi:hypothetical protein